MNSCLKEELSWKSHEGNENTYFDLTVSVGYSMKSIHFSSSVLGILDSDEFIKGEN